jgi:phage/plasmid primase-like uncharacterized protein
MTDITNLFNGAFRPVSAQEKPINQQLTESFLNANIQPPEEFEIDGQIHRFSTNGKSGDSAGWYVLFQDPIVCGAFGCWRDNVQVNFKQSLSRDLSATEQMQITRRMSEAKARRKEAQEKKNERAADTVQKIWDNAGPASSDHPYLQNKSVGAHGARVTGDGRLMLPLYVDGELSSLQYIDSDGDKKYHAGGKTKGAMWHLGSEKNTVYIAEGYATAASIHEATGQKVYLSFSANNLINVAKFTRQKYGAMQKIVIVADNDESGTGQKCGKESADLIQARIVIPPITGDANDYAQNNDLLELLEPKTQDFLIPADDFCQQPAPIKWLVKGWLQDQALIMVHGPSGGGKTFSVLDMALRVASGTPEWCGNKVNAGKVVYLAGEGHHGLRSRIAAWKQHNKVSALDMWLSRAGCDLNTAEGYQTVTESIDQLPEKPSLIIVDTLHRFLKGDENSAQDAKTMLDACGALMSQFNCSVLLVHHTGVDEGAQHRARGSSAWRGALDIEISVVPGSESKPMELVQRKSKDAELAAPIYGDLTSEAINGWIDEDGEPVTSAVFLQTDAPLKTSKEDKKINGYFKLIERAFFAGEAEIKNENPYVSRSVLHDVLVGDGMKENSIKQALKPSEKGRLIGALTEQNIIKSSGHGWEVICPKKGTILQIQRNG